MADYLLVIQWVIKVQLQVTKVYMVVMQLMVLEIMVHITHIIIMEQVKVPTVQIMKQPIQIT